MKRIFVSLFAITIYFFTINIAVAQSQIENETEQHNTPETVEKEFVLCIVEQQNFQTSNSIENFISLSQCYIKHDPTSYPPLKKAYPSIVDELKNSDSQLFKDIEYGYYFYAGNFFLDKVHFTLGSHSIRLFVIGFGVIFKQFFIPLFHVGSPLLF